MANLTEFGRQVLMIDYIEGFDQRSTYVSFFTPSVYNVSHEVEGSAWDCECSRIINQFQLFC